MEIPDHLTLFHDYKDKLKLTLERIHSDDDKLNFLVGLAELNDLHIDSTKVIENQVMINEAKRRIVVKWGRFLYHDFPFSYYKLIIGDGFELDGEPIYFPVISMGSEGRDSWHVFLKNSSSELQYLIENYWREKEALKLENILEGDDYAKIMEILKNETDPVFLNKMNEVLHPNSDKFKYFWRIVYHNFSDNNRFLIRVTPKYFSEILGNTFSNFSITKISIEALVDISPNDTRRYKKEYFEIIKRNFPDHS